MSRSSKKPPATAGQRAAPGLRSSRSPLGSNLRLEVARHFHGVPSKVRQGLHRSFRKPNATAGRSAPPRSPTASSPWSSTSARHLVHVETRVGVFMPSRRLSDEVDAAMPDCRVPPEIDGHAVGSSCNRSPVDGVVRVDDRRSWLGHSRRLAPPVRQPAQQDRHRQSQWHPRIEIGEKAPGRSCAA